MISRRLVLASALSFSGVLGACSCGAATSVAPAPAPPEPSAPPGPSYEVHEWGLVRGTATDGVMLSGPHAVAPPMPVAKPVLYFHRAGEGALEIDVTVHVPSGRIVEHWPRVGDADPGSTLLWHDVIIEAGTCTGTRYPGPYEAVCMRRYDGCEASELRVVETADADCLHWPDPPHGVTGPAEVWNHLFYRGEVDGTPNVGLRLEPQPDGTLRVTSTSTDAIAGRLVRVHRSAGYAGAPDAVAVVDPPAPGSSVVVPAATAVVATGADALAASLSAAGLTADEVAAFRRAWDAELFGAALTAAAETRATATTTPVAAASPMGPPPAESSSLLYVLPVSAADGLAELRFDPAPTAVRRAIVAWIDEARAPSP